jgi:hypothetical protein
MAVWNYVPEPTAKSAKFDDTTSTFTGTFGCKCFNFECNYRIKPERSDFTFLIQPIDLNFLMEWQYGIESTDFMCLPDLNGWSDDLKKLKQEDVDIVLRGMVEHPGTHLHIYNDEPMRKIRVGVGLSDPFLFLFQLRFQLCIDPNSRKQEVDRLKGIFTLEWLHHESDVSPKVLFGLENVHL